MPKRDRTVKNWITEEGSSKKNRRFPRMAKSLLLSRVPDHRNDFGKTFYDQANKCMATTLSPSEEAQLTQTIEMFEVIAQSQPHDYQSLEILKEAYLKLGRDTDVVSTAKRIAQAYVDMGQFSSAILEYETILQRFPEDADVQAALRLIESKANRILSKRAHTARR